MEINKSGATFSSIVGIGAKIKKMMEETGEEYLFLNRGINAVCSINLTEVIRLIDFNSAGIQVYPPNKGLPELREAINQEYFDGKSHVDNIAIVPGGMSAIDSVVQILDLDIVYFSKYFWGSYQKLCMIRGVESSTFENLKSFVQTVKDLRKSETTNPKKIAVLLCDPNNPVGNKLDDVEMLNHIKVLTEMDVIVIFDSPYRRLFYDSNDILYQELLQLKNLIITESFSKTMGLSGQRIGFIHSTDKAFNDELNVRLLYAFNGVNAFAQELVLKLLTSPEGKKAVSDFKKKTVEDVTKNIQYLNKNNLLFNKLYEHTKPVGIFTVVNITEDELLKNKIGSVGMVYFTNDKTEEIRATSRICVSVPHEKFKLFFYKIRSVK
ncbi:MAG: pyridoxal phosphate-dependent aminotransferase [Flavobacteriaceae bacterium]|nr:pyridoxal phosphate-dependent aminotransferase [Flavobacteriaceae bacterium]